MRKLRLTPTPLGGDASNVRLERVPIAAAVDSDGVRWLSSVTEWRNIRRPAHALAGDMHVAVKVESDELSHLNVARGDVLITRLCKLGMPGDVAIMTDTGGALTVKMIEPQGGTRLRLLSAGRLPAREPEGSPVPVKGVIVRVERDLT